MAGRGANTARLPVGFWHWLAGQQCAAALPQAMAPIAFTLAAVTLSQQVNVGAAMVSGMTACQVVCAIPLSRIGEQRDPARFLRTLLLGRAVTLLALTLAAATGLAPAVLVPVAALTGVANASIVASYRLLLSGIVPSRRLPRAVALGATANELVFVIGPVIAAVLGILTSVLLLAVMTLASAVPALLLARVATTARPTLVTRKGARWSAAMAIWLVCYSASAMAVAVVEVGAVALALRYGLAATAAVVFTLSLCLASVSGGVAVIRAGGDIGLTGVLGLLAASAVGAIGIGLAPDPWFAAAGCLVVGLCLAPLGTFYSVATERLTPESSRAQGFSALRTAQGLGVIATSLLLTVVRVGHVALVAAGLELAALTLVLLCRGYLRTAVTTGRP